MYLLFWLFMLYIELLFSRMHIYVYTNAYIYIYFGFHGSYLLASNH